MKIYVLTFSAVLFLLQACVSEPVIQKKSSGNMILKTEENEQADKPEPDITGNTDIKKSSVGSAKTVKIKFPSKPPELTPEQERAREEAFEQMNVPE